MNFSDFIIDAEDFEFFESLPASERILFLYDLICDESYGTGSNVPEIESHEIEYDTQTSRESFLAEFESKISSMIDRSIKDSAKYNVAFLNNIIVINSNYKKEMQSAAAELLEQGLLISKQTMTERMTRVFHKQKYCVVYKIIGKAQSFSLN